MTTSTAHGGPRLDRLPAIARLAVGLEVFLGIGALGGGGQFVVAPDGHLIGMSTRLLAGTPFHDFLVPGLVLFLVLGVAPLLAAAAAIARRPIATLLTLAVAVVLGGWIVVEMAMLGGVQTLFWAFYLVLACLIAGVGITWRRSVDRG
jgi:hypothetical protein